MNTMKLIFNLLLVSVFFNSNTLSGQWVNGVYEKTEKNDTSTQTSRLMIKDSYLILTTFNYAPASFNNTVGGILATEGKNFTVNLEFNSAMAKDSLKTLKGTFQLKGNRCMVVFDNGKKLDLEKVTMEDQNFEGAFLMAGRVTDQGESRRRIDVPRITMKMLLDGHFQWIAFNKETFEFSGTGGGKYIADNTGAYIEQIEFFSRNSARVGAKLPFKYNIKGNDWFHQGNSSSGEPMHEIWTKRMN
ncbi:hypothetical protein LBMAG24_08720 [Bacteroidota bacterium]|nr:hypothetical protein LBMAG24_08720 [Bacteroidota bacterium]